MLALVLLALGAAPAPSAPPPPSSPAPVVRAPEPVPVPTVEAPSSGSAVSVASPAALALEHDGRTDGAVLISDLGLALTTARPLVGAQGAITAAFADGRSVPAHVIAQDPARDLALLRLDAPGPYAPVELAPGVPAVGAPVTAMVAPGAQPWNAVPGAVVAATGKHLGHADPLRLTARMATPVLGEGGPLVDADGKLLGIVVSPEAGQDPAEAVAVAVDSIRAFLDASGGTVAEFNLLLETTPPGATVTLDGHRMGTPTPVRVAHLALGRHQVAFSAPGMATDVVSVELIRRRDESLKRTLDPGGTLEVTSDHPASVWIDGTLRGQAPLRMLLPSGEHVVDGRAHGLQPATEQVQVATGQVARVELHLEPELAAISMTTVPAGAQVSANGVAIGKTPLHHAKVPAGAVKISIAAEGHHSYEFPLTLAPGEDRDLGNYRLEAPYGWLDTNLPPGTQISIDGASRHAAQRYERLPVGAHQVRIFAPDYYAYSEKLAVSDAQTLNFDPPLARYDHLPPRRAFGFGLTALGAAAGLVSIGLATDSSSKSAVGPTLIGAVLAAGAGVWCLVTSHDADQAGWSEERTWAP